MCDVRKSAVRLVLMGLAVGLLAGALTPAKAQTALPPATDQTVTPATDQTVTPATDQTVLTPAKAQKKKKQGDHARRETNATRLARVQRSIEDTYSHRYEVIGGGGYLRFQSGDYTKNNNEVSWATALNYYLNPKLAIVGDARGSFGDAHQQLPLQFPDIARPQINEYTFMGGASYRFYAKEKVAYSVQALAGTAWGLFSGGAKGLTGNEVGLWNDGLRPAFSLGVSADYNVYPNLALRLTPTWVGTDFAGTNTYVRTVSNGTPGTPGYTVYNVYNGANGSKIQSNIGFNAGVVYRFGRR
jgi:hypothetical protein